MESKSTKTFMDILDSFRDATIEAGILKQMILMKEIILVFLTLK